MYISDRVVEILLYVINELHITKIQGGEALLLAQFLTEKGYTHHEIAMSIPWFMDRPKHFIEFLDTSTLKSSQKSYRLLSEWETTMITPAAHGYLIQLREFGIVSEQEMEVVLEQATNSGLAPVGVGEIEAITSAVLLGTDKIPHGTYFHYDHSVAGH